jgi:metal-responsive CopG/Arc/MetJ family transcriptional regulator
MKSPKVKVSVTVSKDLLGQIDKDAARLKSTRSAVIDRWLRAMLRERKQMEIEQATIAYYESLTDEERAEDERLTRALSKAARKVKLD